MDKKENKQYTEFEEINIGYSELNTLLSYQNIMSQKVSILSAINVVIISIAITLSLKYDLYGLFSIIPFGISLIINIHILIPNIFTDSKTGYYFKNLEDPKNKIEILEIVKDKKNLEELLISNAKTTKEKYRWFYISLFFSFPIIVIFAIKSNFSKHRKMTKK